MEDLATPPPENSGVFGEPELDRVLAAAFGGGVHSGGSSRLPERGLPRAGERFGGFTLLGVLGEGGMGVVFEARQAFPERVVALKLVRPERAGAALLERFQREARFLARLAHPGIARVFEAGEVQREGRAVPYLVMERVHGEPLDRWVSRERPDRRTRIALVAELADAVQHAHQRGVLHRDIKPGNVLVEEGRPRLLDFGIAREAEAEGPAGEDLLATRAGTVLGTLPFMAPEQLAGDPELVDTRADVYALGVLLHLLLVDRLPHDFTGRTPASAALLLERTEPLPLGRLDRSLRGDLESIVTQALERDPERRYGSAAALADDLRRHLRCEPVSARKAGFLYQAGRLVRRHRLTVSLLLAGLLLLSAGGYLSSALLRRKNRQVEGARQETLGLHAFLLEEVLFASRPDRAQGEVPTVIEAVERAAERVGEAELLPAVEAAVRETLGEVFWKFGRLDEAEQQLRLALELSLRADGARSERTLRVQERLARVLAEGEGASLVEARELAVGVRSARLRDLGAEHPDTLAADYLLAGLLRSQGEVQEAQAAFARIAATRARVLGPEHENTLYALSSQAECLGLLGRPEEALELRRRVVQGVQHGLGPDHPETLVARNNLANLLADLGQLEEAEGHYRDVAAREERVHGPNSLPLSSTLNNLGVLLVQTGRGEEALPLVRRALEIRSSVYGPDHRRVWLARHNLATLLCQLGREEEGLPEVRAVLAVRRERLGAEHQDTLGSVNWLAGWLVLHGQAEQALEVLEVGLDGVRPDTGNWVVARALALRGAARLELGDLDGARGDLLLGEQGLAPVLGPQHPFRRQVLEALVRLETEQGDEGAAASWSSKLEDAGAR